MSHSISYISHSSRTLNGELVKKRLNEIKMDLKEIKTESVLLPCLMNNFMYKCVK